MTVTLCALVVRFRAKTSTKTDTSLGRAVSLSGPSSVSLHPHRLSLALFLFALCACVFSRLGKGSDLPVQARPPGPARFSRFSSKVHRRAQDQRRKKTHDQDPAPLSTADSQTPSSSYSSSFLFPLFYSTYSVLLASLFAASLFTALCGRRVPTSTSPKEVPLDTRLPTARGRATDLATGQSAILHTSMDHCS